MLVYCCTSLLSSNLPQPAGTHTKAPKDALSPASFAGAAEDEEAAPKKDQSEWIDG